MTRFCLSFAAIVIGLLCCGCERREKQYTAEGQTALQIIRLLEHHHVEYQGVTVTNLSQLTDMWNRGYPHFWHRRFGRFGKHKGFTNSFYEKYLFFPSGLTNQLFDGELVLMNAQPYPDPDGTLERSVIIRTGESFHWRTISEERIQRFFKELGIPEPKPTPMPPPPPAPPEVEYREPLSTKIERFYSRLAESFGVDGDKWRIFRDMTVAAVFLLTAGCVFLIWRSRHRPR